MQWPWPDSTGRRCNCFFHVVLPLSEHLSWYIHVEMAPGKASYISSHIKRRSNTLGQGLSSRGDKLRALHPYHTDPGSPKWVIPILMQVCLPARGVQPVYMCMQWKCLLAFFYCTCIFQGKKKKKILFHSFFLSCLVKKIAEYTYKTNCVVFWKKTCIAIDFASSNRDRLPGILPCGPKRRGVGREMGRGRVTAVQGWVQLLLQVYHRDIVWVETSGTASV